MGRLPGAWMAPPGVRELREEVRYRHKLTRLQTGFKCRQRHSLAHQCRSCRTSTIATRCPNRAVR